GEEPVRERERLPMTDHGHVERHAVTAPEAVAYPPDVPVVADRVVGDEHLLAQDQHQHDRPEDGDDRHYDLAGLRRALLLAAALGGLLVVVAGWLLPQADVSGTAVPLGLGVGVGIGLGGGALGVLRRREAAVGAAVGLAILAVLVAVDGVHGTAWAGFVDGVAIAGVGVLARSRPRIGAPASVRAAA